MSLKKHSGSIEVIFGPMFSSKTSTLLKRYRKYKLLDKNYIPKQEWVYYDEFDLNIMEDIVIKPHIIVGDMIVYM